MTGWIADQVGFLSNFLKVGGVAGALALSVICWGARFHSVVRWPFTEAAILAFGGFLSIAAWMASGLEHDRTAELKRTQRELVRWQEVAMEQAAQRERYQGVARRQMHLAQNRAFALKNMQEIVDEYEDALASGSAGACAADNAYSRAMQSIRISGPEGAETAEP